MALQNSINLAITATNPLSATNGGLGVSNPIAHGLLVGQGANPASSIVLTDGQILIGKTGFDPVAARLAAGSGIQIDDTTTPGMITIKATGMASYINQTAASATMVPNMIYGANSASLITFTLPTTAAPGDLIRVTGVGTGLYQIAQSAGQSVRYGDQVTTSGTSGSVVSKSQGDSIELVCTAANTGFQVLSSQGYFDVL